MVFAEALSEYLMDGLSEALAQADEPTPPVPLAVDRYVALSALQKAIRRGEEELALPSVSNAEHVLFQPFGQHFNLLYGCEERLA